LSLLFDNHYLIQRGNGVPILSESTFRKLIPHHVKEARKETDKCHLCESLKKNIRKQHTIEKQIAIIKTQLTAEIAKQSKQTQTLQNKVNKPEDRQQVN